MILDFGIYRRTLLGASTARRTNHRPEGQINSGRTFHRAPLTFIIQDIIDKSHVLKVRVLSDEDGASIPGADAPNVCAFKVWAQSECRRNTVL